MTLYNKVFPIIVIIIEYFDIINNEVLVKKIKLWKLQGIITENLLHFYFYIKKAIQKQ